MQSFFDTNIKHGYCGAKNLIFISSSKDNDHSTEAVVLSRNTRKHEFQKYKQVLAADTARISYFRSETLKFKLVPRIALPEKLKSEV